jgi:acylphosphatase
MKKNVLFGLFGAVILLFIFGFTTDKKEIISDSSIFNSKEIGPDCTYNGFSLHGKIKFVENFPDIKVQIVNNFPDLRVKLVENFPDNCGEWQVVENFPDIKVQIVENFPDIKVQYVENFPGLP